MQARFKFITPWTVGGILALGVLLVGVCLWPVLRTMAENMGPPDDRKIALRYFEAHDDVGNWADHARLLGGGALTDPSLRLVLASGEVPYDARRAEEVDARFNAEVARAERGREDLLGRMLSFTDIAAIYGCDLTRDNAYTTCRHLTAGGVAYLLLDTTFNASGNNCPHRFLIFRAAGIPSLGLYDKVLDYPWHDGWSHPEWLVAPEGLYIAAWFGAPGERRTFQRVYQVIDGNRPLRAEPPRSCLRESSPESGNRGETRGLRGPG